MSKALERLNDDQKRIAKHTEGNVLVLAGAGSGKTSVLTSRIAYLIEQGVLPWQILSLTFTNKASKEMKERLVSMVGPEARDVWMGTFHSVCIRILIRFGSEIGLDTFTLIDDADQKKLIKEVIKTTETSLEEKYILSEISDFKNSLQSPDYVLNNATNSNEESLGHLYMAYEEKKQEHNYIDYDDCIMKTVHLFRVSKAARDVYHSQFKYVLTDETQDTNTAQFELLKHLSAGHHNLFAVGDVDQCQPPETLVRTPDGERRIDELKNGDNVISWNRNAQYATDKGYPIEVASREYEGDMFTISADNKSTRATPNHKFLVRWTEHAKNLWVTYLMYREDRGYRVGWCQLFKVDGGFHLGTRARLEKADKVWILNTHSSKKEATVYENFMSLKYGIPMIMFEPNNALYTEEVISEIFSKSDYHSGLPCLIDHKKSFDYPIYPYPTKKIGRPSYFECYASNLIPELMSIPTPGSSKERNIWTPITDVDVHDYKGLVYSLDVEEHHNYIADGLVTLNSIYAFRGAKIENIMKFSNIFPDTAVYKLEQNYRSTPVIVNASNAVISGNKNRYEKTSFAMKQGGSNIIIKACDNEKNEAEYLANVINAIKRKGRKYEDVAILYRTNRQSQAIEARFMKESIPYQIVGGQSFADRKEVKDIVAYLRAISSEIDELAFARIINVPKRGIGETTVGRIKDYADECGIPFSKALENIDDVPKINAKTKLKIKDFSLMIEKLREKSKVENFKVSDFIIRIYKDSGYEESLQENTEENESRKGNIKELVVMGTSWDETSDDDATLSDFLTETSLSADIDKMEDEQGVTMMTVHSSKGLEFPFLFVVGIEEGMFPSGRALGSEEDIEEERRLFYVAMTRAEERLFLSYAMNRYEYNNPIPRRSKQSRFLYEIPEEYVRRV